MKIVNDNKPHKCGLCNKNINQRRKVRWSSKKFFHISCIYEWVTKKVIEYRKMKNTLSRYKKDMVIEKLK